MRKMIINAMDAEEVRIAVLEGPVLEDFDIESRGSEKNKGNIYNAKVVAVEPALNAAFVNYGADKQGFLTATDVDPRLSYKKNLDPTKTYNIDELLRPKQELLVQINKDEVGVKGAVLTTHLSLAGRYVVLMPDSARQGISRKIENEEERKKIREATEMLDIPEGMGVIIRTAGKDRTRQDLSRDLKVLQRLWTNIQNESKKAKVPALIFKEQDVVIRSLRDYFSEEVDEIIVDSDEAYDRAAEYMHMVMPNQKSVLTRYVERRPIFHHYGVEEQLEAIYQPKVTLPAGSSLVIEPTEALVSIDVNSGKQKSGTHEDTAAKTNMAAAREVARQLRLRDLGGIIVIDFIDMNLRKNQMRVEKVLREALKADQARIKVGRISRNGTLELTRQRIRTSVQSSMFRRCAICKGTGHILNPEAHAIAILRNLRDRASRGDLLSARVQVEPQAANLLRTDMWPAVKDIEERQQIRIDIQINQTMSPGQDDFTFETDPKAVVVEPEAPNFGPAPIFDEDGNLIDPKKVKARKEQQSEDGDLNDMRNTDKTDYDLPAFKFITPARLGYFRAEEEEDESNRSNNKRRRGRRGGRNRRGGEDDQRPQDERQTQGERDRQSDRQGQRGGQRRQRGGRGQQNRRPQNAAAKVGATAPQQPTPAMPPKAQENKVLGFFKRMFGG